MMEVELDEKIIEAVEAAIIGSIRVDATGLAPVVARAFIVGIDNAARAAIDAYKAALEEAGFEIKKVGFMPRDFEQDNKWITEPTPGHAPAAEDSSAAQAER